MSLNTSHANDGVLIHCGERIILFCDSVQMEFSGQDGKEFKGSKNGRLYLTSHRMIFNNKKKDDAMRSFSFPFITLKDVELEQPVFGANYIKGKVRSQPGGNFTGEAKFKLYFNAGGAIDFGKAMLNAAMMASRNYSDDAPPAYRPPMGNWYAAPPPAYSPPSANYYQGWVLPYETFPDRPAANTVYMTDAPPPYPGIEPAGGAAGGFASGADAKAAEAAQSAAAGASAPMPPQYYEAPPSYEDSTKKNN